MGKRRKYDREFKTEAVRLVVEKGLPPSRVERDLGIGNGTVGRWVREFRDDSENAFPGHGRLKPSDEELRRLKREVELLRSERDILKKAVAIFSKDPNRYSDL